MSRTYGIAQCVDCSEPFVRTAPTHRHCGCVSETPATVLMGGSSSGEPGDMFEVPCDCGCGVPAKRARWQLDSAGGVAYFHKKHGQYHRRHNKAYPCNPDGSDIMVKVPCACGCGHSVEMTLVEQGRRMNQTVFYSPKHSSYYAEHAKPYPYKPGEDPQDRVQMECGCGCKKKVFITRWRARQHEREGTAPWYKRVHADYYKKYKKPHPHPDGGDVVFKCACGCGMEILVKSFEVVKHIDGQGPYVDVNHKEYHTRNAKPYPSAGLDPHEIISRPCACGCGVPVSGKRSMIQRHAVRYFSEAHKRYRDKHKKPYPCDSTGKARIEKVRCACGCKKWIKASSLLIAQHDGVLYYDDRHRSMHHRTGECYDGPDDRNAQVTVPCSCGCGRKVTRKKWQVLKYKNIFYSDKCSNRYSHMKRNEDKQKAAMFDLLQAGQRSQGDPICSE